MGKQETVGNSLSYDKTYNKGSQLVSKLPLDEA